MRYKLTFVAGFAVGYVFGAKAGRKRYDTISDGMRRLADSPVVQEAAGVFQAQASGALASARSTVGAKVSDTVSARIGSLNDKFFRDGRSASTNGLLVDPDKAPPYPQAGHEEFGGDA